MPTDYDHAYDCGGALQSAGRYSEAATSFLEAMRLVATGGEAWVRAALKAAVCAFRAGQIAEAQQLWRQVAEDESAPVGARVEAAGNLAVIEQHHGDIDAARRAAEAALALAQRHGMGATVARQHGNLGLIALQTGDLPEAHRHLLESASGFGDARDPRGQAQAWNALGEVALRQGHPDVASQRFHDAFELLRHLGAFREAAVPAANLAHLLRRLGRSRDALAMYGEVQAVVSREGDEGAGAWRDLASVHSDLGDHVEAGRCLERAGGVASTEAARAHLRVDKAGWLLASGQIDAAAVELGGAQGALARVNDLRGRVGCELLSRRLRWRRGADMGEMPELLTRCVLPEIAAALAWEAAELAFEAGDLEGAGRSAEALTEQFQALGQPQRSAEAWGLARTCEMFTSGHRRHAIAHELDQLIQTLAAHGDVRTAVALGLEPTLYLALLGELEGARLLHRTLTLHRTELWPVSWSEGLDQISALLELPDGSAQPPTVQDLVPRLIYDAMEALRADDGQSWSEALARLRRHHRLTLAAALSGLPARLGKAHLGRSKEAFA